MYRFLLPLFIIACTPAKSELKKSTNEKMKERLEKLEKKHDPAVIPPILKS